MERAEIRAMPLSEGACEEFCTEHWDCYVEYLEEANDGMSDDYAQFTRATEDLVVAIRKERDDIKAQLEAEIDDYDELSVKLGGLLRETANILKGPPPEGTLWSYHDIPEQVQKMKDGLDGLVHILNGLVLMGAVTPGIIAKAAMIDAGITEERADELLAKAQIDGA